MSIHRAQPAAPLSIVFFGTEQHSLITLRALQATEHTVVAVITKPDTPRGRGGKLAEPAVKTFARQHGISVWQPTKLGDIADDIASLAAPLGVLVSYGKLIPQSIIDLFPRGIINIHPSLLPRYRGPSPIEAAMTHRDSVTGVSLMQLDAAMDAGPIYHQTSIKLYGTETRAGLYERLFTLGSQKLIGLLPHIADGSLQPTPQNDSHATYCRLLSKADAPLDPSTLTAPQAEARVRAYLGFPRTTLAIHNLRLIVTAAHIAASPTTPLDQQFADGQYLIIDQLISPTSGKHLSAAAFLRGQHRQ